MKFVGYMLFVLILTMCRSYAHERKIFLKNASIRPWICHLLICPYLSCWQCLCSNCGYLACLCLNFSMVYCSLYICEAHACICRLDTCITNKGGRYPIHVSRESFASREEKLGEMHLFRGACIHAFGSSFLPEF
jgi:hypothetical protein